MVLHKHGDLLYNGLKETITEHLSKVTGDVVVAYEKDKDSLLAELSKSWDDHKMSMLMIRDILMYMVK